MNKFALKHGIRVLLIESKAANKLEKLWPDESSPLSLCLNEQSSWP